MFTCKCIDTYVRVRSIHHVPGDPRHVVPSQAGIGAGSETTLVPHIRAAFPVPNPG